MNINWLSDDDIDKLLNNHRADEAFSEIESLLRQHRSYTLIFRDVPMTLTYDPADDSFGISYAWDEDDYADGFARRTIVEAIVEWADYAPEEHPKTHGSCYGCLGTGTLQWANQRPGQACTCVSVDTSTL